jgi:hypothetical protein
MSTADLLIAEGEARGEARGRAEEKELIVCTTFKKVKDVSFVAEVTLMTTDGVIAILKKNGLL